MGKAVGGLLGIGGTSDYQTEAAQDANRVQKEMYDQTRNDLSQYRNVGGSALSDVQANLNDLTGTFDMEKFTQDPGYAFRQQEGQKAIERGAAAIGGLTGGATLKALARYGQDYASNEYNNAYNRFNQDRDQRYGKLMDLAGMGQNAATQTGQFGQNYANAYGQNVLSAANARAADEMMQQQVGLNLIGQGFGAATMFGLSGSPSTTKLQAGTAYQPPATGYQPGTVRVSDRRLKKNIFQLPQSPYEVPLYAFEYKDERHGKGSQIGVMAQDLLSLNPNHKAVSKTTEGYMVDYSLL